MEAKESKARAPDDATRYHKLERQTTRNNGQRRRQENRIESSRKLREKRQKQTNERRRKQRAAPAGMSVVETDDSHFPNEPEFIRRNTQPRLSSTTFGSTWAPRHWGKYLYDLHDVRFSSKYMYFSSPTCRHMHITIRAHQR